METVQVREGKEVMVEPLWLDKVLLAKVIRKNMVMEEGINNIVKFLDENRLVEGKLMVQLIKLIVKEEKEAHKGEGLKREGSSKGKVNTE